MFDIKLDQHSDQFLQFLLKRFSEGPLYAKHRAKQKNEPLTGFSELCGQKWLCYSMDGRILEERHFV